MKTLTPIMVILLAATVVILASLPLAQTEWADGLRAFARGHGIGHGEHLPAALLAVLSFVKQLLLIGIPGALLVVVLRVRKPKRSARTSL